MLRDVLDVVSVRNDSSFFAHLDVGLSLVLGETPLVGLDDQLASRELHLSATKRLESDLGVLILGTDAHHDLLDANTSDNTLRLTVRVTHTGLKSISTGARKHLVNTKNVERMSANSHVELIFSRVFDEVLVASNTGSLESLGGNLLLLVGKHVAAVREVVDMSLLVSDLVDSDLGVRHTTAVARLDVRLILAVTVAVEEK